MNTQIMKLSDIRPAVYNPKEVFKPDSKEWETLKSSIENFGLVEPLIVNIRNNVLISGHQRYNILKSCGEEEIEVVIVDLDEKSEKMLNLSMNKIEGLWDYEKLEVLFKELETEDILITGFTEKEITDILKDLEEDVDENNIQSNTIDRFHSKEDNEEAMTKEKPFQIYLSFPTKEEAEEWLKEQKIEKPFSNNSRNLNIKMEGVNYETS